MRQIFNFLFGLAIIGIIGCDVQIPDSKQIKISALKESSTLTTTKTQPVKYSLKGIGDVSIDMGPCVIEEGCQLKVVIARECDIHDAPNGKVIDKKARLFDLYYVFDIKQLPDSGTWFNIGHSPVKSVSESGWICYENEWFYKWIHRVGFRPQRIKSVVGEIPIYETFDDLKKAQQSGNTDVHPIASLRLPTAADALKSIPFPILEQKFFSNKGNETTAYHIAMIGKMDSTKMKNIPSYSSNEVDKMSKEIQTLDLVICLDTTGSMEKWMVTTKETVKNFASSFKSENIDCQVSLVTYRDADDGDDMLHTFPFESIPAFCKRLGALDADGGGDDPEAGYPALAAALKTTSFRNRSQRILIIVGDSGYHAEKGKSNPDGITNDDVIQLAHEKHAKVFLMAVGENKVLANQLKDVIKQTEGTQHLLARSTELADEIHNLLKKESTEIVTTSNVFQKIVKGESNEQIADSLGKDIAEVTNYVRILKETKGIDTERLRQGKAVVLSGWIAPFQKNQIAGSIEVMLFREECEEILGVLQDIIRVQPDPHLPAKITGVAQESRLQNPKLGEYFNNSFLPHREGSVLQYSLEDISRLSEYDRKRLQDNVFPLIGKTDESLKNNLRWTKLPDDRIRGWIPEECLP